MPDISQFLRVYAREREVRLDIVERDYALSYLLAAIAVRPQRTAGGAGAGRGTTFDFCLMGVAILAISYPQAAQEVSLAPPNSTGMAFGLSGMLLFP
jgi:hypothetical protein